MKRTIQITLGIFLLLYAGGADSTFAQNWQSLGFSGESVNSIAVDQKNHDVLFFGSWTTSGPNGKILKSTDGGVRWDTLFQDLSIRQIVLHPWTVDTIFAVSGGWSHPGIVKSCDGGKSWAQSDSGIILDPDSHIFSMAINPVNPSVMYSCSGGFGGGYVYKSTNSARSWTFAGDITDMNPLAVALDPQHPETLYVGSCCIGGLWESLDGAVSFDSLLYDVGGVDVIAIDPEEPDIIYALISRAYGGGPFAKSTNRGKTWSKDTLTGNEAYSLVINPIRPNEIYVALVGSRSIFQSTDRGDTWTDITGNIQGMVPNTLTIDPIGERLYLGSSNGLYVLSLPTSVGTSDQSSPKAILLNQNFPNPFNPSTTIRYELPKSSVVRLSVFDILGRDVAVLVNERREAGVHEVKFDGSSLASGVFFYRIEAGSFVQTRKLLLVK
jgi:hypothetical protein